MTKWKLVFRISYKFIKNQKLKFLIYKSIQTLDPGSDLLKTLLQLLQPWVSFVKPLQALHTWIWPVNRIYPDRSSQAFSGWKGSIYELPSSDVSTDGPLKDNQRLFLEPQRCLRCMIQSSSCWKVNCCPSLKSCALWSRFSSRTSLHSAAFFPLSVLPSLPVTAAEKPLPPSWFTVGMVLAMWWIISGVQ